MAQIKFSKQEGLEFDFSEGELLGMILVIVFLTGAFFVMFR